MQLEPEAHFHKTLRASREAMRLEFTFLREGPKFESQLHILFLGCRIPETQPRRARGKMRHTLAESSARSLSESLPSDLRAREFPPIWCSSPRAEPIVCEDALASGLRECTSPDILCLGYDGHGALPQHFIRLFKSLARGAHARALFPATRTKNAKRAAREYSAIDARSPRRRERDGGRRRSERNDEEAATCERPALFPRSFPRSHPSVAGKRLLDRVPRVEEAGDERKAAAARQHVLARRHPFGETSRTSW